MFEAYFNSLEEKNRAFDLLKAHDHQGFSDELFVEEILRRLKVHENKNWIFTYSGQQVFLANPSVESINLEDIAHAQSNLCRYNGQCNKFFCVGEHAVLVADEVLRKTGDVILARSALMHDSAESYLCDLTAPLKDMMLVYTILESRFEIVIKQRFGLEHAFDHPEIKKADYEVFFSEIDALFDGPFKVWGREGKAANVNIIGFEPQRAKERFLQMAEKLGLSA